MTQDEIIKMARQSGIIAVHTEGDGNWHQQFVALKAFAKLVTEKEREACAKICETLWTSPDNGMSTEEQCYGDKCADEIRARGQA